MLCIHCGYGFLGHGKNHACPTEKGTVFTKPDRFGNLENLLEKQAKLSESILKELVAINKSVSKDKTLIALSEKLEEIGEKLNKRGLL